MGGVAVGVTVGVSVGMASNVRLTCVHATAAAVLCAFVMVGCVGVQAANAPSKKTANSMFFMAYSFLGGYFLFPPRFLQNQLYGESFCGEVTCVTGHGWFVEKYCPRIFDHE